MLYAAVATISVCAGLLAVAAMVKANQRVRTRSVQARLHGYGSVIVKLEDDLDKPLANRVMAPASMFVARTVQRLVPSEYLTKTRHRLILAGKGQAEDLDRFVVSRILALLAVPLLVLGAWELTSIRGLEFVIIVALIAVAGVLGPDAILNRMVQDRQEKIRNKLPDILDLLTISVEAGLGFEQALGRTVTMVPGPLAEEFSRTLGELRAGASRRDAFTALEKRTEVVELRSFILALLQADTFGVSVGSLLRNQAMEMRVKRRQRIQEKAQKAPVKMLFPMVFCIMPAMFVIIAGPAVIGIYHAFHH